MTFAETGNLACTVHADENQHMPTIQIRNVPEAVAEKLKQRASAQGRSLSDYLRGELERLVEQATLDEIMEEVEREGRRNDLPDIAAIIREGRSKRP